MKTDTLFKNRLSIQLRFNDIDMVGHVNNTVYFNFFDLGKTSYFEAVKGSCIDWMQTDIVIRHIEADFQHPTFLNDEIEVCTAVVKLGNKSLMMEQHIIDVNSHQVKCTCNTVMVGFDRRTNSAIPISEEWKCAIRIYEENSIL